MTERKEVKEIRPELERIQEAALRETALKIAVSMGDDRSVDQTIWKA